MANIIWTCENGVVTQYELIAYDQSTMAQSVYKHVNSGWCRLFQMDGETGRFMREVYPDDFNFPKVFYSLSDAVDQLKSHHRFVGGSVEMHEGILEDKES